MFYTYLWLREDGTPYYAGKGHGIRGLSSSGHRVRRPKDKGLIILQDWPSEEDAFEAEKFLISYYGRVDLGTGCLRNLTNGGEGHSNPSDEVRSKLREFHTGRTHTEESRRKMSETRKGRVPWNKGKKASEEVCRRMSESRKGRIPWNKGKPPTEDTRRRLQALATGRIHSEETRRKMREAHKKWWASEASLTEREKRSHARIN